MKFMILLLIMVASTPPPPPPPPPIILVEGLITNVALDHISWVNRSTNMYNVYHTDDLVEGTWSNIGFGVDSYQHNNPDGFYKVSLDE